MSDTIDDEECDTDLWVCRWPNGEVSIARGTDKISAIMRLDQDASASVEMLEAYEDDTFYVGYTPTRNEETGEAEWVASDDLPEEVYEVLGDPEDALKKLEAWNSSSLAYPPEDDKVEPLETIRDFATRFRQLADRQKDGDKKTLWLDAARGMDAAAEALDNLKLAGAE